MNKRNLPPADQDPRNPSYSFKNLENDDITNTILFNEYIKSNKVEKIYTGTLWAEGPAYIPHLKTLVWSDIPKKIETDSKNEIQVSWQSAVFNESMYLLLSVKDERFQPQDNRSLLANGDHLGIRLGDNRTYYLRLGKPGKITPYYLNSIDNLINSEAIKGYWQPTKDGYRVEIKVDKKMSSY